MCPDSLRGPEPPDRLGDVITDGAVRGYYREVVKHLENLHGDVAVRKSEIDLRAEFAGRTICRIVPYRELLHIQVGDSVVWETRVRTESGFMEAMGRILEAFLRLASDDRGALRVRSGPYSDSGRL